MSQEEKKFTPPKGGPPKLGPGGLTEQDIEAVNKVIKEREKQRQTKPIISPPAKETQFQPDIKIIQPPTIGKTASLTVGNILQFNKDYIDKKMRNEKLADYKTPIGLEELTGPDREKNINKVKARFAHVSMATAESFVKTLPVAALGTVGGAGGAVIVSLVGAATAASLLNPVNRKNLDNFVRDHPQEFMASLAGAVLAGVSVVETRSAIKDYTKAMTLKQRQAFEKKWDEIIDDVNFKEQIKGAEFPSNIDKRLQVIEKANARKAAEKIINDPAYFEQQLGAEYPSRAIEVPTPTGDKIWVSNPVDPEQEILYNFINGLSKDNPGDVVNKFWKDAKANNMALWYDAAGTGQFESVTVPELLNKYPGLKEPYINPALIDPSVVSKAKLVAKDPSTWINPATLDPNLFNKADIVARLGTKQPSMLTVALAVYASQGYLTKEQLDALLKANSEQINALKEANIQIPRDYTDASLREKDINDFAQDTEDIIETLEEPTPPPPEPPPIPPPDEPYKAPQKIEEPPPEETTKELPGVKLSKVEREEQRDLRLRLYNGPKQKYRVKFTFRGSKSQTLTVEARSFPEAVNRAQGARRGGEQQRITDVVRL